MSYHPITPIGDCPNCGRQPEFTFKPFRRPRMECACGVCGPYPPRGYDARLPEHAARSAWNAVWRWNPVRDQPPPTRARAQSKPEQDTVTITGCGLDGTYARVDRAGPPTPRSNLPYPPPPKK